MSLLYFLIRRVMEPLWVFKLGLKIPRRSWAGKMATVAFCREIMSSSVVERGKKERSEKQGSWEPGQIFWEIKQPLHSTPGSLFPQELVLDCLLHRDIVQWWRELLRERQKGSGHPESPKENKLQKFTLHLSGGEKKKVRQSFESNSWLDKVRQSELSFYILVEGKKQKKGSFSESEYELCPQH